MLSFICHVELFVCCPVANHELWTDRLMLIKRPRAAVDRYKTIGWTRLLATFAVTVAAVRRAAFLGQDGGETTAGGSDGRYLDGEVQQDFGPDLGALAQLSRLVYRHRGRLPHGSLHPR